jgi:GrpB-like predicted nucleotidyltransferase (UPF0157 family)
MLEIEPYDPTWANIAATEAARWRATFGPALLAVHHIGSTSVPGLAARPVIDLLAVFLHPMEAQRATVEGMGYEWLGEYGLPGRRYCRRDDPVSGRRLVQAHCYVAADPGVRRHLAFRDVLRDDPLLAAGYESRKRHCAYLHPDDAVAYGECKSAWIDEVERRAMETRT